MLKVYTLAHCSTCRAATAWLRDHAIAFRELAIRETPPTPEELERMLERQQGEIRRLFNTSGQDYRAAGLKDRLPRMSRSEALALLASEGRLVRRPFLIGGEVALVGFKPEEWERVLGGGMGSGADSDRSTRTERVHSRNG